MRKEVRKAKKCKTCGEIRYRASVKINCDYCKKLLVNRIRPYPVLIVFPLDKFKRDDEIADHKDFCDYNCMMKWFMDWKDVKKVDFIEFPLVHGKDIPELQRIINGMGMRDVIA